MWGDLSPVGTDLTPPPHPLAGGFPAAPRSREERGNARAVRIVLYKAFRLGW